MSHKYVNYKIAIVSSLSFVVIEKANMKVVQYVKIERRDDEIGGACVLLHTAYAVEYDAAQSIERPQKGAKEKLGLHLR